EVPDYLRASVWSRYRGILIALAAMLLVGCTFFVIWGLIGRPEKNVVKTADPSSAQSDRVEKTAGASTEGSLDDVLDQATSTKSGSTGTTSEGTLLSSQGPDSEQPPENVVSSPDTPNVIEEGSKETDDQPALTTTLPVEPDPSAPGTEKSKTDVMEDKSEARPEDPDPGDTEIDFVAPVEFGTYLGGKTVLLRKNGETGMWFRLAPRSQVHVGDQLLALPAFRPRITLTNGIHIELTGGSLIALGTAEPEEANVAIPSPEDSKEPALAVIYGRIILVNTGRDNNPMRLTLGETVGAVRLGRNATLAVEVERPYVPGRDPRQMQAPIVAHLYAPDGNLSWEDSEGAVPIDEPAQWVIDDGVVSGIQAYESASDWIDQETVSQPSVQLYGAPVVESSITTNLPVDDQLLELFQTGRRKEVKSLVARCSVYVGLFAPFVESLRDSEQRAAWKEHIETLRTAMALSPEVAGQVRQTLVIQRGEEAASDLYEMLCGYSKDQIGLTAEQRQVGALDRLIDWLENDSLDYRVLASQNLWDITGKHLMPNPAGRPDQRAKGIHRWRQRLKKDDL
ncbi:MAG: hypothetical protein ACC700_19900, partial [Anaerolineales bacterium]